MMVATVIWLFSWSRIQRNNFTVYKMLLMMWRRIHVTVLSLLLSISEGSGNMSSIVCLTEGAAAVGKVPMNVIIDRFPVPTAKMFFYKENPIVTTVLPPCSFRR